MDLPPTLPAVMGDDTGAVVANFNPKFMRNAVAQAFENIGGVAALSDWARANKTDFYTKMASKLIVKEVQIDDRRSIDDVINELDGSPRPEIGAQPEEALDAEFRDAYDYS